MSINKDTIILGIESSCDETSAAVIRNGKLLSNFIAGQKVHERYGGVVPELASRAHQQNIIPVVDTALKEAGIVPDQISAVAFTRGPGLMGALLVGTSFAKSFAQSLDIPIIEVNHMRAHILAHFIEREGRTHSAPEFPFLCLTVSGGHTQIVLVNSTDRLEIIGQTIDDAAGEAFDKTAKILGLPYPGGPMIDQLAKTGNAKRFEFARPKLAGYDYSFSGLKTSILYFIRDQEKLNPEFIEENKPDLCASIQTSIVQILLKNFEKAANNLSISQLALAGGVSANSELRASLIKLCEKRKWKAFIPEFEYCTDNAAMIAMGGYFKYLQKDFAPLNITPFASLEGNAL